MKFFDDLAARNGRSWFEKQRTIDLIDQARAAGLQLKTTNPAELLNMRMLSSANFQAQMDLLRNLKSEGVAARVKRLEARYGPTTGWTELLAPTGEAWRIRDDLMPLWKNAVAAKGLWRRTRDCPGRLLGVGWHSVMPGCRSTSGYRCSSVPYSSYQYG